MFHAQSETVKELSDRAWKLSHDLEFDSALYYSNKALELANKADDSILLFNALIIAGKIESDAGVYDDALRHFIIAEELALGDQKKIDQVKTYLGRLFVRLNAPKLALEHKVDAYLSGKGRGDKNFYEAGEIAGLFSKLKLLDSSLYYYKEQINIAAEKGHHYRIHAYNNTGFGYANMSESDSALRYYRLALEEWELKESKSSSDTFMFGMINGNIGSIYAELTKFETALPYLETDYSIAKSQKEYEVQVRAGEGLFKAYLELGYEEKAEVLLSEMELLKGMGGLRADLAISKLLLKEKRLDKEAFLLETEYCQSISDSMMKQVQRKGEQTAEVLAKYRVNKVSIDLELQQVIANEAQANLEVAEQREKNSRMMMIFFGIGIIVLLIVGVIFFRQKRKQALIEQKLLQSEKANLDAELKLNKMELTDFALDLGRGREFSENVLEKLERARKVSGAKQEHALKELSLFIKGHLNTGTSLALFQENVDKINKLFFEKLTQQFPNLTNYEKELCGLLRLNLSNKEIASIKGISPNSARISKYRLKKKMNLPEEEDIVVYIQSI